MQTAGSISAVSAEHRGETEVGIQSSHTVRSYLDPSGQNSALPCLSGCRPSGERSRPTEGSPPNSIVSWAACIVRGVFLASVRHRSPEPEQYRCCMSLWFTSTPRS